MNIIYARTRTSCIILTVSCKNLPNHILSSTIRRLALNQPPLDGIKKNDDDICKGLLVQRKKKRKKEKYPRCLWWRAVIHMLMCARVRSSRFIRWVHCTMPWPKIRPFWYYDQVDILKIRTKDLYYTHEWYWSLTALILDQRILVLVLLPNGLELTCAMLAYVWQGLFKFSVRLSYMLIRRGRWEEVLFFELFLYHISRGFIAVTI